MSQSGHDPLALPDTSNALPSPSPSSSDLSEPQNIPLNTPKSLVSTIRDILSQARAKKKNLTVNGFARCFAALDSLDLLLSCGDHLEASLQAFKSDLLAEVTSLALRAPSASYATAAASAPSAAHAAVPPPPKPPAAKSFKVVILLDRANDILALPVPEIKAKVEAAIAATGNERIKGVALRGVKVLPRSRLLVATDSERAASLLRQSAAHWVPKLARNGSLVVPRCQIVVDAVPLTFNSASPTAAHELYALNRNTIADPSAIAEVRWLNPKALRDPKKKASSLLVTLTDIPSADYSIAQGLAIESTICYPHRYEEPPLFCFNCQKHGHIQHHCKQEIPTCARCAGPHRSSDCPCTTSSTKCAPGKRCDHFAPRCANCKGKHPAYYKDCPVRIRERELQRERHRGRIFFDPNFDPFTPRDDPSPLFFAAASPPPDAPHRPAPSHPSP